MCSNFPPVVAPFFLDVAACSGTVSVDVVQYVYVSSFVLVGCGPSGAAASKSADDDHDSAAVPVELQLVLNQKFSDILGTACCAIRGQGVGSDSQKLSCVHQTKRFSRREHGRRYGQPAP